MTKLYFCVFGILFISMLTFPLIAISGDAVPTSAAPQRVARNSGNAADEPAVLVLFAEDEEIREIPLLEYLVGVIAYEMGPRFEKQALKAQAVAAHTMLLFRQNENRGKDYDITSSSRTDQGYFTYEQRKSERYGEDYEADEQKLQTIVKEVINYALFYNENPILAVYHAISGGKTECAGNVWNSARPYLQPVESISDMLSDGFATTVTYTRREFRNLGQAAGAAFPENIRRYFSRARTSDSGTVTSINIGDKTLSGQEVRAAFNLRSAKFDLNIDSAENFVFTVRGFGHGVGLSQHGANFMAESGSDFREILQWYYRGAKIKNLSD